MQIRGYIMNRLECFKYTNGFEYKDLTYIRLLSTNGILELYAVEACAKKVISNYSKGDLLSCFINLSEETILGKQVSGRIVNILSNEREEEIEMKDQVSIESIKKEIENQTEGEVIYIFNLKQGNEVGEKNNE